MEAVDELEAERNQQGDRQHHEGADGQGVLTGKLNVVGNAERRVSKPRRKHQQKHDGAGEVRFFVQVRTRRRAARQLAVHCCIRHIAPRKHFAWDALALA